MQKALLITIRVLLGISGVSMIYLLFVYGHTELTPLSHVVAACTVAAVSASIAGLLQWVGLPAQANQAAKTKSGKKSPASKSK